MPLSSYANVTCPQRRTTRSIYTHNAASTACTLGTNGIDPNTIDLLWLHYATVAEKSAWLQSPFLSWGHSQLARTACDCWAVSQPGCPIMPSLLRCFVLDQVRVQSPDQSCHLLLSIFVQNAMPCLNLCSMSFMYPTRTSDNSFQGFPPGLPWPSIPLLLPQTAKR